MRRLFLTGGYLVGVAATALFFYELTAKSPALLGQQLPGWYASHRAEVATPWSPPTGILPLDKLLHESEEALRFYGLLDTKPYRRGRGPARF